MIHSSDLLEVARDADVEIHYLYKIVAVPGSFELIHPSIYAIYLVNKTTFRSPTILKHAPK